MQAIAKIFVLRSTDLWTITVNGDLGSASQEKQTKHHHNWSSSGKKKSKNSGSVAKLTLLSQSTFTEPVQEWQYTDVYCHPVYKTWRWNGSWSLWANDNRAMCCVASTALINSVMQVLHENGFSLLKLHVADIFVEKQRGEAMGDSLCQHLCRNLPPTWWEDNRAQKCDTARGW